MNPIRPSTPAPLRFTLAALAVVACLIVLWSLSTAPAAGPGPVSAAAAARPLVAVTPAPPGVNPASDSLNYLPYLAYSYVSPTPTATPNPWQTIVEEQFEGSFPGPWEVVDYYEDDGDPGEYYWGKRNCRPYQGSYSGWAVGGGDDGGDLGCGSEYPNFTFSWMIYGPFDLSNADAADLTFKMWLNSQLEYDGLVWMASTDGNEFWGWSLSGNTGGWIDESLDLTDVPELGDLTGESEVWIAFLWIGDPEVKYAEGAYVDNVLLRKCDSNCTGQAMKPSVPAPGSPLIRREVHARRGERPADWPSRP